jgi:cytoskeletal protein RodZ
MRRLMGNLLSLLVLAALAWAAWWAWQTFTAADRAPATPTEVLDIDKQCRVFADSGQCMCRHRRTDERLSVPYEECVALARKR